MITGFANAAFEQCSDTKVLADRANVCASAVKLERSCARCYPKAINACEGANQLLCKTFTEVVLVASGTHIHEGKDGDGGDVNRGNLLRRAGFAIITMCGDRRNKPVSPLGYSLDVLLPSGSFAQRFAQRGDIDRQVGLFHKAVRPHLLHELVLRQQPAIALNQDDEGLKRLRRQRNRSAIAEEEVFPGVATEFPELV